VCTTEGVVQSLRSSSHLPDAGMIYKTSCIGLYIQIHIGLRDFGPRYFLYFEKNLIQIRMCVTYCIYSGTEILQKKKGLSETPLYFVHYITCNSLIAFRVRFLVHQKISRRLWHTHYMKACSFGLQVAGTSN
jgi:hypothetical protein